nr:putative mediator of RNA polymerase II transcription subunit 12 [Ciona intestinalis]|eukprot:XP_002121746.1 putative mediator of RNA polymerase II transcription subunit 12 [Ciona intestinalis]
MNMLAGPNHSGVYTVSINPSVASHVLSQSGTVPVSQLGIITQPNQQQGQRRIPQIMQTGQVVNLAPARTPQIVKPYTCRHCQKTLSSRYNVVRHEKICKSNTAAQMQQEQPQPQVPQQQQQQQQPQQTQQQQLEGKTTFQCYFCHKTGFTSQESLTKHQKKCKNNPANHVQRDRHEHGRRVHICKYCAKEFSTKWNVIRHERLFHSPNDPVIVPHSVANGMAVTVAAAAPVGKPERYCRFCGNYFSSKYNAIRHEKICTRVNENPSTQDPPASAQKPIQVTTNPITAQPMALTLPTTQQHPSNQQQLLQQQLSQQTQQIQQQQPQSNIQTHQQTSLQNQQQQQQQQQRQQIIPQQTMVLIEPPTTPYHVCKYCNKQLSTRCDPIGITNTGLQNGQTVATVTGQHMQLPICSSTTPLGLVTPVMASLPQVAFVQPPLQQLHQTQPMVQHQQPQQQQNHLQPEKLQGNNQNHQHQINIQHLNLQQQPRIQQQQQQQHLRQQLQPAQQQQQQQQHHQQQEPTQAGQHTDRPHGCKYCEKHFATKWYLDQHEKIHTGEADMCKQCGKYFVTRWHLDKHMRVHMSGGSTSSKRLKKEAQSTTTTAMTTDSDNTLVQHVPAIEFQQQILVEPPATSIRQIISSAATVTVSADPERGPPSTHVVSASYPHPTDNTQVFLQTINQQQISQESAGVSGSRENTEQQQQQTNQDKNQQQQHTHQMSISYA